jgi:glutaredoxin 3
MGGESRVKHVRIYTTQWCGYCVRAKRLLENEGVPFEEIEVDGDHEKRAWLVKATGQRTVPQLFFGDESVGGCDELTTIIYSGKLDEMIDRDPSERPQKQGLVDRLLKR